MEKSLEGVSLHEEMSWRKFKNLIKVNRSRWESMLFCIKTKEKSSGILFILSAVGSDPQPVWDDSFHLPGLVLNQLLFVIALPTSAFLLFAAFKTNALAHSRQSWAWYYPSPWWTAASTSSLDAMLLELQKQVPLSPWWRDGGDVPGEGRAPPMWWHH